MESIEFSQPVRLGPNETKVVRFTPERFPQLELASPRLWWPAQVGPQNLYPLDLQFQVGGEVSDSSHIRFGVRQVTSEIDDKGHRLYQINGQNILIRGAGYSMDLLLRSSPERQEAQLKYVRDLNLNAIRLEGKLEDEHFLELCDQLGILVMAGWCCCDQWENWGDWDAEDERVAGESLRDQIRRLERHPSVFTWLYGSDFPPPPKVEEMYLRILKDCDWPNPSVSSASGKSTTVGQSGMKMTGPYEYVAPSFWYLDTQRGGAYGFNTETSPGPAIPPIESLRLMLPEDHLWPVDSVWEYHAGGMSDTLERVHGGSRQALWCLDLRRRVLPQGPDSGLRGPPRHDGSVRPQQVHLHGRHPVDAEQRLAQHDLAPVRLVSSSRRLLLRRQARLRAAARPVLV